MTAKNKQALWVCFATSNQLLAALPILRDQTLEVRDVYTPFPLPELDWPPRVAARCRTGVYSAVAGLAAAAAMLLLQLWSAAYDYPYVVSGKPLLSWVAFLPVSAGLGILASVVCALALLFWQCRLPQLDHALFASRLYRQTAGQGFFLCLICSDAEKTQTLLRQLGVCGVEPFSCV